MAVLNQRSNTKGVLLACCLSLPAAHQKLENYFTWVEPGYVAVHQGIVARLGQAQS